MLEISLERFAAAHGDGAVVIDVREPAEYVAGHVPGASLVPLAQVPRHTGDLDRSRPVYVICATGNRSLSATGLLRRAGLDAYSVSGGTRAWVESGRPAVTGPRAALG
ncbi:MAG: rhodanese-like domain-containing protein [Jatrophihabitans sp.]|nr:MAG: rhodanese-like domain-containing protein [Jatrophihabitans sp.]